MKADAADTFAYTAMTSHVNLPVVIKHLTTGHVEHKNLMVSDIALSTDPTTVSGSWVKVAEYSVPKRCLVTLGHPTGTASNPNSRLLFIPMDDT
jgi:hypothetical protein